MVSLSIAINFWQTFRSDQAVKRLQQQVAPTATVRRDGAWRELPRHRLVVGDVVRLAAGDLVPADARLIEAVELHVDQAALTGESLPAEKVAEAGALTSTGPDSPAWSFSAPRSSAALRLRSSSLRAEHGLRGHRRAPGGAARRNRIRAGHPRLRAAHLADGRLLVLFILVVNLSLGRNALESLLFSVALAVGLTPEFLPMITTVTLAQGATQMAREKVIVKHLSAIQNLGSIDILCSDKTGTLTAGTMSLDASLDAFGRASPRALFLAQLNSRFETGNQEPPRRRHPASEPWPGLDGLHGRPTRFPSTSSGAVFPSSSRRTARTAGHEGRARKASCPSVRATSRTRRSSRAR